MFSLQSVDKVQIMVHLSMIVTVLLTHVKLLFLCIKIIVKIKIKAKLQNQNQVKTKQDMNAKGSNVFNQQKDDEYSYQNQEFQTAPENSYASKVQRLFIINFDKSTYENIELSTTEMRYMMKEVSKILDQKIHKYYGLMGLKHSPQNNNLEVLIENLKMEQETNNKLIKTQINQIKQIELVDQQMASSKRVQKQAQRLRQYFETKKLMLQSDKQTRFSKGQISKAGEYLARDLDSDKHYFKLNKIKEDLQYVMLRDREQTKKEEQLQIKLKDLQQKHQKMNILYNQKIYIAQQNQIQIEENKNFFKECQLKRDLIKKKAQIKNKTEISLYNLQNTILKLSEQVQKIKKTTNYQIQKISLCQNRITQIHKQIDQIKSKTNLNNKIEQSISIKNIESLLKIKKQKNQSTSLQNKLKITQSIQKESSQLTQSSIILKPNFKIKQLLTPSKSKLRPKSMVNKSMDFGKKYSKANQYQQLLQKIPQTNLSSYNKRILKWQPSNRKKTVDSKKSSLLQEGNKKYLENPQNLKEELRTEN